MFYVFIHQNHIQNLSEGILRIMIKGSPTTVAMQLAWRAVRSDREGGTGLQEGNHQEKS